MNSKLLVFVLFFVVIVFLISVKSTANAQVLRNSYSDIYKDERRNRQFPSEYYDRYPPNDRYNFDRRPFQANPNRRTEKFIGDSRCNYIDRNTEDALSTSITVRLRLGAVVGVNVSLCDGPGVPEYDRPNARRNNFSPNLYSNIAVFLGIPYAEPPIRDRRFKVSMILIFAAFRNIVCKQEQLELFASYRDIFFLIS